MAKTTRVEKDSLGTKEVPTEAYYGIQALRAFENFPISGIKAHPELIRAYVSIKKGCALANKELGELKSEFAKPILQACDELLSGMFADQFIVDVYQAGAGTSMNMNVNEVLTNRALELMGKSKGDYASLN